MINGVNDTKISYIPYTFDKTNLKWIRLGSQKFNSPEAASDAATKNFIGTNKHGSDLYCIVKETAQLETVENFSLGVAKSPIRELPTVPEPPVEEATEWGKILAPSFAEQMKELYKNEYLSAKIASSQKIK